MREWAHGYDSNVYTPFSYQDDSSGYSEIQHWSDLELPIQRMIKAI